MDELTIVSLYNENVACGKFEDSEENWDIFLIGLVGDGLITIKQCNELIEK